MRILFLGAHFPRPNNPIIGVWALSQLLALRDQGHEIRAVSPIPAVPGFIARRGSSASCPRRHNWDGIEVEYVRWPLYPVGPLAKSFRNAPAFWLKLAWLFSAREFQAIAESFAPTVLFAHHGQLSGHIAAQLSRRLKVPYFITEHAFGEIETCATNPARKRYYAKLVRGASAWIAVSNRMRDTMLNIFPGSPAVTVHNGGDAASSDLRTTPRPPALADCVIILSVCFFYKRKNVPLLVASFDAIAARYPNARLVIIGGGDDEEAVVSAAKSAAHASQILLCGPLSHREVLQYTVWCDIFVNIAIHEPWATVLSDAMMAGKPIIFAADCGITDVAENNVQGLSVEPGDGASASAALDALLGDRALRLRLAASAETLAHARLTWAANAARMTQLFEEAVAKSP